jgi:hypothetical protein
MDRSVWSIAALFYAAGAFSMVIVYEVFVGFQSPQSATPIAAAVAISGGKTAPPPEAAVSDRRAASFRNARSAIVRTLKDPGSAQWVAVWSARLQSAERLTPRMALAVLPA